MKPPVSITAGQRRFIESASLTHNAISIQGVSLIFIFYFMNNFKMNETISPKFRVGVL